MYCCMFTFSYPVNFVAILLYSSMHTHTHTHLVNDPLSGTTRLGQYQKGKTNLDFTEARDSEWQWHQLGLMQVCTSLQAAKPCQHPTTQFFTGQMPFLLPNQQHQRTEGKTVSKH